MLLQTYTHAHKHIRIDACLKQGRRVTPHIEVVEDGSEGAALFESLLIDDPDPDESPPAAAADGSPADGEGGGPAAPLGGRAGFEQHVRAEVALQLQAE